ncbi:MAG: endolytic transglycosylase MltG [Candidatus Dadabacteria bacterium]|nr:endolytic transglycosylase MltG [Candidatus Dadabacteria bacterium]MDE0477572.1 endolytic transglycosylase MltG [Candidatus Dadabacteria bacterium]
MSETRGFNRFSKGLVVFVSSLLALSAWFYFLDGFPSETKIVEIPQGLGLSAIAEKLEGEGVVRKAEVLFFSAFLSGTHRKLKHGEYVFSAGEAPYTVHRKLRRGEVSLKRVTFPEGITLVQMAQILDASQIVSQEEFLAVAENSEYSTKKLDVDVSSLEGFLFPDTYFFARDCSAEKVIETMLDRFREVYATLGIASPQPDIKEIVTIASLIEKETAFPAERPLVSAVIRNRLRKGMKLEFDPTVIYALGEKFDGNIRKKDLSFPSPYNTYVVSGLPPGPIAAPGLDSIRAALEPAGVDYLYFVANGGGRHFFSTTYRDHLNAVNQVLKKPK